jgi:CRP/FNR family transcriptional regulator
LGIDLSHLRRVPFFAPLDDAELREVAELLVERSFARDQVVFAEDETSGFMYVVIEGRVKVSRWLPNGKELVLAFHPAGDFFGEMALLDGRTLPATVTAVAPTTILSLSRKRFERLLERPGFARALLATLSSRCREAWHQIEILSYRNADARLRLALASLLRREGEPTAEGVRLPRRLGHRELASLAGVSRETATRAMRRLEESGAIVLQERRIVVPDPARLVDDAVFE